VGRHLRVPGGVDHPLTTYAPTIFATAPSTTALSLGGKLAYLFFSDMPMMLLGAGMTFSAPLYSFSMTNPPMQMVVTAEDQQVGGLLMWIVGSIYFIVLASIFFLRWMLQQEKAQQAQEMERDQEMLADLASETFSDDEESRESRLFMRDLSSWQ
jgi:putative membrane protein